MINGAECEPFITCDDLQMRERPECILRGAGILRDLTQAKQVLIGIEDNKPEAIAAMRAAVIATGEPRIEIVPVPTRYPAGGAKQLIRVLTGIEVPHGKRSTDYGVQCFNTGTACAVYEALELGQPLISRIVTVAGNVAQPRNYSVRFGTSMRELIALAGPKPDSDRVIMGGPMMGFRMPADTVPVVKATNCVLVGSPALFPPPPPEMPCIRCGECAKACPADLAAVRDVLVFQGKDFRQGAGVPPVRLHRMRLLRLRLPVAHPAGGLLPFRQERNLGARKRKGCRRSRPRTLRIPPAARRARKEPRKPPNSLPRPPKPRPSWRRKKPPRPLRQRPQLPSQKSALAGRRKPLIHPLQKHKQRLPRPQPTTNSR